MSQCLCRWKPCPLARLEFKWKHHPSGVAIKGCCLKASPPLPSPSTLVIPVLLLAVPPGNCLCIVCSYFQSCFVVAFTTIRIRVRVFEGVLWTASDQWLCPDYLIDVIAFVSPRFFAVLFIWGLRFLQRFLWGSDFRAKPLRSVLYRDSSCLFPCYSISDPLVCPEKADLASSPAATDCRKDWLIFMFWTVKRVVGWVLWLGDVSHSIRPAFHVTLYFVVRPAPLVRRLFGYFEGFLWNERIWIFLFLCLIVFDCDYAPLPS